METLTIETLKQLKTKYQIDSSIGVNHGIILDYKLSDRLLNDKIYDFNVFLPKYNRNLQREYVWNKQQQQDFIFSLLQEKKIEPIITIRHSFDMEDKNYVFQIIDGKQRLLTIKKFLNNEFSITINDNKYKYKNFDKNTKFFFCRQINSLTANVYYSDMSNAISDEDKIKLFVFYNFTGTPQMENFKSQLLKIIS